MNRREWVQKAATFAISAGLGGRLLARGASAASVADRMPVGSKAFPAKFLWGAATAAHQVEGNNINSDNWLLERVPNTMYKEPSGDACDHYHLYEQDINQLTDLGFNAYRFSIEWARIEPEKGFFSRAELEHDRRMLEVCGAKALPPPEGAELTQMGYEFYPDSLERTVRFAAKETGVPVIVTENGIATEDDTRRVDYIQRALAGVKRCIDDGVVARGYIHWSLLDNFEWINGYAAEVRIDRGGPRNPEAHCEAERCHAGKNRESEFVVISSFRPKQAISTKV